MLPDDRGPFAKALLGVFEIYGRQAPSPEAMLVWWRLLEPYALHDVTRALGTHTRTEPKFPPTPAQILALLGQGQGDNRPAADEAWAIALTSRDEAETVVWTDEMAQAFATARPVLDLGDEVGARVAFRAAYERQVATARREGRPPAWRVSLGTDPSRRQAALEQAVQVGQLEAPKVAHLLPAPAEQDPASAAQAAEQLRRLRQMLATAMTPLQRRATQAAEAAQAERDRIAELKRRAAERVAQHQGATR